MEADDPPVPKRLTRSVRGLMGFGSWEVEEGTRVMARCAGGSCSALTDQDGRKTCSIYANRPTVCREFFLGGDECLKARKAAGL